MDCVDAASKVQDHKSFFAEKWSEFCQWVEDCAKELDRYQHLPHGRAKRWKDLTCPSDHEWDKAMRAAEKWQQRLYAKGWIKWAGYDREAKLQPEDAFCTTHLRLAPYAFFAPASTVNPVNWLLGQKNPRAATPDERRLISCAWLIMAHDSTTARCNSIGAAGKCTGKYFARDNCYYEDIKPRLDTPEARETLAEAWDDVRPLLEAPQNETRQATGQGQAGEKGGTPVNVINILGSNNVNVGHIHQTQNLGAEHRSPIGKETQTPGAIVASWLWRGIKALFYRIWKRG